MTTQVTVRTFPGRKARVTPINPETGETILAPFIVPEDTQQQFTVHDSQALDVREEPENEKD